MKNKPFLLLYSLILFAAIGLSFNHLKQASAGELWTSRQLELPGDLAKIITDPRAKQPIIFSVGPGAIIKGSIDIGLAKDSANLAKLEEQLDHLPKDADIVIYCGCCPFAHCPNIRPAFTLLNQMKLRITNC